MKRIQMLVKGREGITLAHATEGGEFCVHFDPARTSSAKVEAIVRAAGAAVAAAIGHASIPVHLVSGEDANRRVEESVKSVPGVLAVSLNMAAQSISVEFERERVTVERISAAVQELGIAVDDAANAGVGDAF